MDDLSISPEELNNIVSGNTPGDTTPAAAFGASDSGDSLSQDDINRLLAGQSAATPSPVSSLPEISPEELSTITGVSPAPMPAAATSASLAGSTARPAQFAPLRPSNGTNVDGNLDMLLGVSLRVTVELGRTRMSIEEILRLGPGAVVELEKLAGEPVDVLINNRLIARGEVVVIDDRFGVRITDVVPPAERVHSM